MGKITDYGTLTGVASGDLLPIVDVSDFTQAGTGSTKKITVTNLLAGSANRTDWLNVVTGYGADPTGVADSTTAIQNAISGLPAAGGVVYLPGGTYKLTSALTIGSGVTLLGAGAAATVLSQTTAAANGITATVAGTTLKNVTIAGLRINGPNTGSGTGISVTANGGASAVAQIALRDLIVYQFGSHGVTMTIPVACVLENVQSVNNLGRGFYLNGGTSTTCVSCYANTNISERGFYLTSMFYSALVGCASDGNAIGYEINASDSVSLTSCGAEVTVAAGGLDGSSYKISGASQNIGIRNCRIVTNRAIGLYVTGSSIENTVDGFSETAGAGATRSIQVDSASSLMASNYSTATSQSFAANTTTILNSFGYTFLRSPEMGGTLTADSGVSSGGNVDVTAAGNGLMVKEGTNAKQGITAAMTAGTITVANTSVTANSRIFLTAQNTGGTAGALRVSARTAGTSFTITSSSATDTSTVAYQIFEPG